MDVAGKLIIDVSDSGKPFTLDPALPSDPYRPSGRGLYLVAALCESVSVTRAANGNNVRAVFVGRPRV
jgi:anti-sigma regulatory factor (Ser/Thr protein kinase)